MSQKCSSAVQCNIYTPFTHSQTRHLDFDLDFDLDKLRAIPQSSRESTLDGRELKVQYTRLLVLFYIRCISVIRDDPQDLNFGVLEFSIHGW